AAIRAREADCGGHTPIVAMTAHAMKGDKERCLEAGMDGYVSKPVRADELRRAINEQTGPPRAAPQLDRAGALERVGGDAELLGELADLFRQDCPRLLEALRG